MKKQTKQGGTVKNEVAVKEAAAVTVSQQELVENWGVPTTPSQDMLVPKILPMQGLSKFVVERKAQIGDFVDSLNGKKLGSIDKPLEVIPFYCQKSWDILAQQPDGSYKYDHQMPLVEDVASPDYNDNLSWEGEGTDKDGKLVKVKRIRRLNFFVLLPDEVAAGSAMPYVLSFKSTSLKEGKKLWSHMYIRSAKAGFPPAVNHVSIGGTMVTNTKGTFVVPSVAIGERTKQKELEECLSWLHLVRKGAVKIDTNDDETQPTLTEGETIGETGDF